VGEGVGEVDGDAASEGVADEAESIVAGPGERAGGEGQQDLCGVETNIVGEVADAVREAAAEEIL
jgi:NTP pyrophosphatase (non-canonical NTP hydrolase)